MRRILLLVLVAAIAFAAGAAGANGTLSRVLSAAHARFLGDVRVGGTPSAAPAGHSSATATAPAVATDGPAATHTAPTSGPSRGPKPPAPLSLGQQRPDGTELATDGWTGADGLTLHVLAPVTTGCCG